MEGINVYDLPNSGFGSTRCVVGINKFIYVRFGRRTYIEGEEGQGSQGNMRCLRTIMNGIHMRWCLFTCMILCFFLLVIVWHCVGRR